jgi:hypothetical protein
MARRCAFGLGDLCPRALGSCPGHRGARDAAQRETLIPTSAHSLTTTTLWFSLDICMNRAAVQRNTDIEPMLSPGTTTPSAFDDIMD